MDSSRLTFLFYRYVENTCTEAERTEFFQMIEDPANADRIKPLMDALWQEVPARPLPDGRSERIIERILETNSPHVKSASAISYPWLKIAAALAFVALCTGWLFLKTTKDRSRTAFETAVDSNEPRYMLLPDGSSVILNAGSTLEFPQSFNEKVREVYLVGEGYFDITHDPSREFIVHTGKLKTTVLGTAFNIQAYSGQENITVTVTRGKVKVSDDNKDFGIVNPNEQITFDRGHNYKRQLIADSHTVTAWMEKDVYFNDVTLEQVVDQLEKRFGKEIEIANDGIKNCRLTATFIKGEDIEQILRIICEFNGATVEKNLSGIFEIKGGECPS
jgi:ferric-dicitrate binding protein FerR (iron transport regulator)